MNTVCVTGASGFIGVHIVKDLLEQGYVVRGTVRALNPPEKYDYLTNLPGAETRLTLLEAELLSEGSYDDAVAGCDYVIHIASPYVMDVTDPQSDLFAPAVKGTLNVLRACRKAHAVRRMVLTSSSAAITDEAQTGKLFTEDDWNEKSSLHRNPYYFSKVSAERTAWEFVEDEEVKFDLVVINPSYVIGPALNPGLNTTNLILSNLLSGGFPAKFNLEWPFVDVRDVASAHRLAMEAPRAKGRYLCSHESWTLSRTAEFLYEHGYTKYRLPSINMMSGLGNGIGRLLSYAQPSGTGTYLRTHIGREIRFDNGKIKRELGMEFIPIEESLLETVEDLLKWGHLERRN